MADFSSTHGGPLPQGPLRERSAPLDANVADYTVEGGWTAPTPVLPTAGAGVSQGGTLAERAAERRFLPRMPSPSGVVLPKLAPSQTSMRLPGPRPLPPKPLLNESDLLRLQGMDAMFELLQGRKPEPAERNLFRTALQGGVEGFVDQVAQPETVTPSMAEIMSMVNEMPAPAQAGDPLPRRQYPAPSARVAQLFRQRPELDPANQSQPSAAADAPISYIGPELAG